MEVRKAFCSNCMSWGCRARRGINSNTPETVALKIPPPPTVPYRIHRVLMYVGETMLPGISTHVLLSQCLSASVLDNFARSGAQAIEIFAVRHHFDYTDRAHVRDLAAWFRDAGLIASLHQPLFSSAHWSRHVAADLNLIDPDKRRRILATDETKRALEAAEQIPFRSITLHMGEKDEPWSPRALDLSLTAIEHLLAFARPLGVQLLLENLPNDVTRPESLLEILRTGHFDTVGITLDVGHAHLQAAVSEATPSNPDGKPRPALDHALDLLGPRIAELHLHDNSGFKDEHCWPGTPPAGKGIHWPRLHSLTAHLPPETRGILEIAHDPEPTPDEVRAKAQTFFDRQARLADEPTT